MLSLCWVPCQRHQPRDYAIPMEFPGIYFFILVFSSTFKKKRHCIKWKVYLEVVCNESEIPSWRFSGKYPLSIVLPDTLLLCLWSFSQWEYIVSCFQPFLTRNCFIVCIVSKDYFRYSMTMRRRPLNDIDRGCCTFFLYGNTALIRWTALVLEGRLYSYKCSLK